MRLILAILVFSFVGCQERPETKILARVNGVAIEAELFRDRLHEFYMGEKQALLPSPEIQELKKRVLQEMILEVLMLKEAKKRNLEVLPAMLRRELASFESGYPAGAFDEFLKLERMTRARFRDRLRNQILLKLLRKEVCNKQSSPSSKEIQDYYDTHLEEFKREEQVRIQQIVVKTREDGEKIREEVKEGTPFEQLARKHSFSPEGSQGGDLGYLDLQTLPDPVIEASKKLKLGEVSSVVETEYGFHVVKVTDRRKPEQRDLKKASEEIRRNLLADRCENTFTEWRHEILSKSKIERNHALLAKLR